VIALVWANIDADSYHHFVEFELIHDFFIGHPHYAADGTVDYRSLTLHYLINDVLMAFFFAIAAKEVWEAIILKNGSLRGRKAATPLAACSALSPFTLEWPRFWALTSMTRSHAVGRSPRPRTSHFPTLWAASSSAQATRRSGSSCSWRLPTTRQG
jgi:hypothetical protein